MSGGYKALEAGKRYLKNLDALAADAQDGITQDDLDAAEAAARNLIDAALAGLYSLAGWTDSPPPLVADIADKLASAEVLAMKFSRDGMGPSPYIELLEDTAKRDLERIRNFETALVDSAGTLIAPLAKRRPVSGWES